MLVADIIIYFLFGSMMTVATLSGLIQKFQTIKNKFFLRLKPERERYEEIVKILSNMELRMFEKVKLAERKLKENNANFGKILEEPKFWRSMKCYMIRWRGGLICIKEKTQ